MLATHFEVEIDKAMKKAAYDSLQIALGDSHNHARIKGVYEGLQMALRIYRDAAKIDIEGDRDR